MLTSSLMRNSQRSSYYLPVTFLFLLFNLITKSEQAENYVATGYLADGEKEIYMNIGDVLIRDTQIIHETPEGFRRGLMLRQVASGSDFVQLIYKLSHEELAESKHRKLAECEVIDDSRVAASFREKFMRNLGKMGVHLEGGIRKSENTTRSYFEIVSSEESDETENDDRDPIDLDESFEPLRNVSVKVLSYDDITQELRKAANIKAHVRRCKRLHRKMEQEVSHTKDDHRNKKRHRVRRETFRVGIMPGTLWCGDGSLADKYESMGAHVGTDRCCREHDGCPFIINGLSSKYGLFNYRMHTVSHCTCDESTKLSRKKRDVGKALRLPGTQWCGRGFSAEDISHLGGFTATDSCCRYHDMGCPFYIESFQEKFGIFNWRMYTINHCTCDERFRSCLKQTNTGAANFVGKIFFNVVQTKCFLLKPEKSCGKTSWFGKCLKYEYKKQAHLRDPIPY